MLSSITPFTAGNSIRAAVEACVCVGCVWEGGGLGGGGGCVCVCVYIYVCVYIGERGVDVLKSLNHDDRLQIKK